MYIEAQSKVCNACNNVKNKNENINSFKAGFEVFSNIPFLNEGTICFNQTTLP
ncbi:hypothetical protein JCM19301_96 [Jejuia pallidilutea]|uniref:Uncharacterized protein n=1 Tax=Jejuia pallidilutea TaxID=504487 RepID=A0A090VWX3_9FLAO|nr:hypothetical protein JCM19301_96 [Jejuia pallidilutea]GAL71923.1 hypothetical protein JCM19302_430 [Jejuia pallidilutea]GAL89577.1 hypothetical protein JCM19538_559 [Jejuia pallidilutea]